MANPTSSLAIRDQVAKDAFIDALNNPSFEFKVREKEPSSFNSALKTALRLEALYKSTQAQRAQLKSRLVRSTQSDLKTPEAADQTDRRPQEREVRDSHRSASPKRGRSGGTKSAKIVQKSGNSRHKTASVVTEDTAINHEDLRQSWKKDMEEMLKKFATTISVSGHETTSPPRHQQQKATTSPVTSQGYYNSAWRQQQATCAGAAAPTYNVAAQRPPVYGQRTAAMNSPVQCFYCQEYGHFQRNCPYKPPINNNTGQTQQYDSTPDRQHVRATSTGMSNMNKVYLNVKIRGRSHNCLLDSGCEITVIPSQLVDKRQIQRTSQNLLAANGTKIPVLSVNMLLLSCWV